MFGGPRASRAQQRPKRTTITLGASRSADIGDLAIALRPRPSAPPGSADGGLGAPGAQQYGICGSVCKPAPLRAREDDWGRSLGCPLRGKKPQPSCCCCTITASGSTRRAPWDVAIAFAPGGERTLGRKRRGRTLHSDRARLLAWRTQLIVPAVS